MKILIIANSRYKGGLSGGDAIYESFKKFWPCELVEARLDFEYSPFFLCYLQRVLVSIGAALLDRRHFDLVYSASDFLPDSIPAFIYRLKGKRWLAGFYLKAFKSNPIHYYSQKLVHWLITCFADMVVVTNPTMYDLFPNKKKTWINGGVDLSLAGLSDEKKIYDAVFCGRIHPTKGIDELLEIWDLVRLKIPTARLAIIGDGDLGIDYVKHKLFARYGLKKYNGIDLLGYMGDERFKVYKQSKIVIYPTPLKYDHFSMAPVEAMACGCPLFCFSNPVNRVMANCFATSMSMTTPSFARSIIEFINTIDRKDINVNTLSTLAASYASKFDYQNQALRVFDNIQKELYEDTDHWSKRNGRPFFVPSFKRSRAVDTNEGAA